MATPKELEPCLTALNLNREALAGDSLGRESGVCDQWNPQSREATTGVWDLLSAFALVRLKSWITTEGTEVHRGNGPIPNSLISVFSVVGFGHTLANSCDDPC